MDDPFSEIPTYIRWDSSVFSCASVDLEKGFFYAKLERGYTMFMKSIMRRKSGRRIISLLSCLAMVLTLLPAIPAAAAPGGSTGGGGGGMVLEQPILVVTGT